MLALIGLYTQTVTSISITRMQDNRASMCYTHNMQTNTSASIALSQNSFVCHYSSVHVHTTMTVMKEALHGCTITVMLNFHDNVTRQNAEWLLLGSFI